jgi:nucleotide-binding universal stress UspA family protein
MIERVLIPVDFSDTSLQALDYAIQLAEPFEPEFLVLFVVEPVYLAAPFDLYGSVNLGRLLDEQRRIGCRQLERLVRNLRKRQLRARSLIQTGSPHQAIVDSAKRIKADLIVMATHGRSGLPHVLLGSVAERVVRNAPCPVLTVNRSTRPVSSRRTSARKRAS